MAPIKWQRFLNFIWKDGNEIYQLAKSVCSNKSEKFQVSNPEIELKEKVHAMLEKEGYPS